MHRAESSCINQEGPSFYNPYRGFEMPPLAAAVAARTLWLVACGLFCGFGARGENVQLTRPCDIHPSPGKYTHPLDFQSNRSGIVLWSWGRCGTGTIYTTLMETTRQSEIDMQGVCGIKEGLPGSCLASKHIDTCLTHIPEESIFFTHIKPKYLHVRSAEWDDPTGMFMALQQRGAKVIVPVARRNWLARDISAIDMHMTAEIKRGTDPRKTCNHAVFARATCPGNCVRTFRMYEKAIEQGTKAARSLGLHVVPIVYGKESWPCPAVEKILHAAVDSGVLPRMPSPSCVEVDQHVSQGPEGSHSLEDKMGPCVAAAITRELTGTEFEWMLDIEREFPPPYSTFSYSHDQL